MNNISLEDVGNFTLPLPPLAEQHRIVAKVNELMALCDQLKGALDERERRRDRLAAVSLNRIGKRTEDEKAFREHARFHLANLPKFTTRSDQIPVLRKTILDLAVRGRLVSQEPNDEPAAELIKRISAENPYGKKRQKVVSEIENHDEPTYLPQDWSLVPLLALGSWAIGAGFPKNEQGLNDGPYFFLKVSDMNLPGNEKYITTSNNRIDDDAAERIRAKIHPPGTIIFPKIGGAIATNKRRILTQGSAIDSNCLGITFSKEIDIEWAYLLLISLDFTQYQAGTAMPALQQGVLERIPIGLPPFPEQHRIVAKFDELMALCDRLETLLTSTQTESSRLLESLLHQALEPPLEDVSA